MSLKLSRRKIVWASLASSMLATSPLYAQSADDGATNNDDEIVVTAQKREENLQNVPISIQALGTKKLDQLNVTNFEDFSKLLPSVAFQSTQPGVTTVYMRGVASGGDGNHSGSLPSVGVYLDEQPVTTIGGTLDVHIYDIARIESLAGPQGTLYGASSQAGTIRIITNKPSTAGFEGRVDGELNTVKSGGVGGRLEGMINAPLSDRAALRVVSWFQKDAGYIDNVAGTRRFLPIPGGITVNNAAFVKKDFNDAQVYGARAALKVDLDDNWTVTPAVIYQKQINHGVFSQDPRVGDLKVQRFFPDSRSDKFVQAALTIEGKIGNFDVTYAGAYLDRKTASQSDYTDYSEAYDALYASSGGIANYFYFQDNAGNTIDPRQLVLGSDHFKKLSQELRVASPADKPFRVVAGAFFQRQSNEIHQDYFVQSLAARLSVNGHPQTLWLTEQDRVDKDYALFGEASYDILPNLTLTAGGRGFKYDNSLIGFFGFGRNPAGTPFNGAGSSRTGVAGCYTTTGAILRNNPTGTLLPAAVRDGPCTNLADFVGGQLVPKRTKDTGFTHRLNLTWKPSEDLLTYATWSRGFRPGGINRRATIAPYAADFLTNFEVGLKSTLMDGKLRVNAALYQQEWKAFQFSFLGANSFTEIHNGPNARIRGFEADINLKPADGFTLTAAGSYTDAKTRKNLCAYDDPTFRCTTPGSTGEVNFISAESGTRLPVTPRFKISGVARYEQPVGNAKGYLQATVAHASSASADIRRRVLNVALDEFDPAVIANPNSYFITANTLGRISSYTTADFSVGMDWTQYSLELFIQNAFDERAELSRSVACGQCFARPTVLVNTPRTIGVRVGGKF